MVHLYGISTCGSVRKGLAWLKARDIEVTFHNFRKEGLSADELDRWLARVDAQTLLNRRDRHGGPLTKAGGRPSKTILS